MWAHAWDLEATDDEGGFYRNEGLSLPDYYTWGAPVMAPADGRVVRVVNHLPDNEIGEVDTVNNWGNLVILWHVGDVYTALCHLRKDSIAVVEGQMVCRGQFLGKVGNSGRSPHPHLHFQFQASSEIGAPTRYGEILHCLVQKDVSIPGATYVTHGCPEQGEAVSSMEIDEAVKRAAALTPGRQWVWNVPRNGRVETETWTSEIDALGGRSLRNLEKGDRVQVFVDHQYTTLMDYAGSGGGLLGLFYLGLGRLPFLKECSTGWEDSPDVSSFLSGPSKLIYDLLLPFVEVSRLKSSSSFRRSGPRGEKSVVTTVLSPTRHPLFPARFPDRIEVELDPGQGPCGLRAYRDGELLVSAVTAASAVA